MIDEAPNDSDRTPKSGHRTVSREAKQLLQQVPAVLRDNTPPHQNTRSRRTKLVTQKTTKTSPVKFLSGAEKPKPTKITQVKDEPGWSPQKDFTKSDEFLSKMQMEIESRKLQNSMTSEPPSSVPPTPGLDTARCETPTVDLTPRKAARDKMLRRTGVTSDVPLTVDDSTVVNKENGSDLLAFESTSIKPLTEQENFRPPRWSFRQVSPIKTIEPKERSGTLTSSFEETEFNTRDIGIQVSSCPQCTTHRGWSDMKPVVMVFVLMMLSLLYRGLLKIDPLVKPDVGNALGIMAQGSFMASFCLEDYMRNIFG